MGNSQAVCICTPCGPDLQRSWCEHSMHVRHLLQDIAYAMEHMRAPSACSALGRGPAGWHWNSLTMELFSHALALVFLACDSWGANPGLLSDRVSPVSHLLSMYSCEHSLHRGLLNAAGLQSTRSRRTHVHALATKRRLYVQIHMYGYTLSSV